MIGIGVGKHKDGMHRGSKKGGMFTFLVAGLGKAKLKDSIRGKMYLSMVALSCCSIVFCSVVMVS